MAAISRSHLPNLFFEPYLINIRCSLSLKYVIQLTRSTITEVPVSMHQGWGQVQYLYLVLVLKYIFMSTWCMEMPKYLYLYLTKKYLVLTSNFQVPFIKKCKKS